LFEIIDKTPLVLPGRAFPGSSSDRDLHPDSWLWLGGSATQVPCGEVFLHAVSFIEN
jgi:hypothetical protein